MAEPHDQHRHRVRLRREATALRYPEIELVSVPAKATNAEPRRPFLPDGVAAGGGLTQQQGARRPPVVQECRRRESGVRGQAHGLAPALRREATAHESAYRPYSWPVASVSDLRLAPFHLVATEGKVHNDRDHVRHMETLPEVSRAEPSDVLFATCPSESGAAPVSAGQCAPERPAPASLRSTRRR